MLELGRLVLELGLILELGSSLGLVFRNWILEFGGLILELGSLLWINYSGP